MTARFRARLKARSIRQSRSFLGKEERSIFRARTTATAAGLLCIVVAASLFGALSAAPPHDAHGSEEPSLATVTTLLQPGFNLVGWTRADAPVAELFDSIGEPARAAFAWDPLTRRYRTARRGAPAFLNDLNAVRLGQGLWVLIDGEAPLFWTRAVHPDPDPIPLFIGLNLVASFAPDATPVADALVGLAAPWSTLFAYDSASQRFLTFNRDGPSFLNTLAAINQGDGLWIRTCGSASWPPDGDQTVVPSTLPCVPLTGAPAFEFQASVTAQNQRLIRDALTEARLYFSGNHALDVTAFTVFAFADTDSLVARWLTWFALPASAIDSVRQRWSGFTVGFGNRTSIWINTGSDGWRLGSDEARRSAIIHEYFHVLQLQASGFGGRGPLWLFEGAARYVETVVAAAAGRTDLAAAGVQNEEKARGTAASLSSLETEAGLNRVGFRSGYALGYLAAERLTGGPDLAPLLEFWRLLGTGLRWEQAFALAFGVAPDDFYAAFESDRASSFPPLAAAAS